MKSDFRFESQTKWKTSEQVALQKKCMSTTQIKTFVCRVIILADMTKMIPIPSSEYLKYDPWLDTWLLHSLSVHPPTEKNEASSSHAILTFPYTLASWVACIPSNHHDYYDDQHILHQRHVISKWAQKWFLNFFPFPLKSSFYWV